MLQPVSLNPASTGPEAGDARLAVFDHRRGWQLGLLGAALTLMFCVIIIGGAVVKTGEKGLVSFSVDFYVFWAAAKLALAGTPLDAFSVERITEAAGQVNSDWMPWAYPPGFLLIISPLGALPFAPAWAVFTLVSLAAVIWATRPFAGGWIQVLAAAALAPAMLPCLLVGQTTLLWIAGLLAALAALRDGRPVLAGLFIGLLTLKPQLGLLIPVALLACGAWRTIMSATLTAVAAAGIPTLIYGTAYWSSMLAMMSQHGEKVRNAIGRLDLMISPYSAIAGLGVPETTALLLQWTIAAVAACAVFVVWRKPTASFDLRAAVLLTAIPLASPYLWHYESALLAPAALFMLRAGIVTTRPLPAALGLAMWLDLGAPAIAFVLTGEQYAFRAIHVPVACIAFAACLRHAFLHPRASTSPATP